MNQNLSSLESIISFRKGANAQGVRAELCEGSIPVEIQNLLIAKSTKKTK